MTKGFERRIAGASARAGLFRTRLLGAGVAALLAGLMSLPVAAPAAAASFDCSAPKARDENAVCVNRELSELDVKMATLFDVLSHLLPMGQRGALQDGQKAFLAYRATCGSKVSCIRGAYQGRIAQLNTGLEAIYARGPF